MPNNNPRFITAIALAGEPSAVFLAIGASTPSEGRIAPKAAVDNWSSSEGEGRRDPSRAFQDSMLNVTFTPFQNSGGVARGGEFGEFSPISRSHFSPGTSTALPSSSLAKPCCEDGQEKSALLRFATSKGFPVKCSTQSAHWSSLLRDT